MFTKNLKCIPSKCKPTFGPPCISVCPFVALLKSTYAENVDIFFCLVQIKKLFLFIDYL